MTAPDATCGQPAAAHRAMLLQRFDRVCGTRWIITARGGQIGGESHLIRPHEPDEHLSHQPTSAFGVAAPGTSPARSNARLHWSRRSAKLARYADGSARTTTSTGDSNGSMSCRTISRSRRFTRFRSTELCEYFGTMTPARGCGGTRDAPGAERRREAMYRTSRCAVRTRFPFKRTALSSPSRVSRAARGKR